MDTDIGAEGLYKSPAKVIMIALLILLLALAFGGLVALAKSQKTFIKGLFIPAVPTPTATAIVVPTAVPTKTVALPGTNQRLFEASKTKEEMPSIDITQAKFLFDSGKAIFIDARSIEEYEQAHIKGALPIPAGLTQENIPKFATMLKDKILVTYCHGSGCHLANKTANALFDAGYRKVCIFWGGWPHWTEAKFPITQKEAPKP